MNEVKDSEKTIEERIKELESKVEALHYTKYIYYLFGCLYFAIIPTFLSNLWIDWLVLFSIVYFGIIFFGEIVIKSLRFLLKQNNNNPLLNDGEEK